MFGNLIFKYSQCEQGIISYFDYLVSNNYGFISNNIEPLAEIDLEYNSPFIIDRAIIDIKDNKTILSILENLDTLGCSSIEIRIYKAVDIKEFYEVLKSLEYSSIRNFCIIIANGYQICNSLLCMLLEINRVSQIRLYEFIGTNINDKRLSHSKQMFSPNDDLTKIGMIIDLKIFAEAQKMNAALNKLIYIDNFGDIRNYPGHSRIFGNITGCNLVDIIESNELQKIWRYSNDQIEKCKDCQYRYICLSFSDIYYKRSRFYKKSECRYNPRRNAWFN